MQATTGSAGRGQARPRAGAATCQVKRVAPTVLGSTALLLGLKRRSVGGTLVGLADSGWLYRGINGQPHVLERPGTGDGPKRAIAWKGKPALYEDRAGGEERW